MHEAKLADIRVAVADVVAQWRPGRDARLARTALDPADFAALAQAGLLTAATPVEHGGTFESTAVSLRPIVEMLRSVATVDPSVALVASMHPGVLGQWLGFPEARSPDLDPAWQSQRRFVFDTARQGHWWGTISSEPGSGGDLAATRAVARPAPGGPPGTYLLSGDKHFGSGSGVTSFMVTTARAEGEPGVELFFVDQRGRPWDASAGCELVAPWDGVGMRATQSHAMRFADCPVTRFAAHGHSVGAASAVGAVNLLCFVAVVLGVVDAAVDEARAKLAPKADRLGPFEATEWARAVNEAWLFDQALEGGLRAVEAERSAAATAVRVKAVGADLAESCVERLCRVVGGGSFSQRSPFSRWRQDVRALGFLRPPWSLTYDALMGGTWAQA